MKRFQLYATASVFGLLLSGQIADAQTAVTQNSNNSGNVSGTSGDGITLNPGGAGVTGDGVSLSVSTTGAASTVSVLGIAADFVGPAGGFGNVNQTATNTGSVTTPDPSPGSTISIGSTGGATNALSGSGVSVSIGATGAVSAFGITGIGGGSLSSISVGNITQNSSSSVGAVSNAGTIANTGLSSGAGNSLSVSATGAAASVSATFIETSFSGPSFGNINQTATKFLHGNKYKPSHTHDRYWLGWRRLVSQHECDWCYLICLRQQYLEYRSAGCASLNWKHNSKRHE